MKVLFLVPYPNCGPSTRYRVQQYLPYLGKNNIEYKISPFISEEFYKIVYKYGRYPKKIIYLLDSLLRRLLDIFQVNHYDIIFIHLEAFPIGPPLLERLFSLLKKHIIFDLDDLIYTENRIFGNRIVKILKYPWKVPEIIRLSDHIITCNTFLKKYASQFTDPDKIDAIHTCIDTDKFTVPEHRDMHNDLVIGWIGSHTTAHYLNLLTRVFQKLAKKYNFLLKVVGANKKIELPGVQVLNEEWSLMRDVESFQSLDIGVYPLIDNEWVKGKTGFKTIQYMSVGVPVVASNVGANRDIIQNGINGFLVSTEEEWIEKISLLIEDSGLRRRIGLAGRETSEEKYSLKVNAPRFLGIIQKVYSQRY